MALAKKNTPQVIFTRASMLTTKDKVQVSLLMQMEPYTKVLSTITKSMELVNALGLMAEYTMGTG